eukprot:TRINITY_DN39429_c0_g1_i1.p1 TRINITY_DN39429_c0_g1~~TRINITY_DN39429_c0_g1_i1.p1  ORF type:complete len:249 (+),score=54.63 TRINITY_DN39429_c0_g1_i1:44-748(+)
MSFLAAMMDPTAVLCMSCVLIPMFKDPGTTAEDRWEYATDPIMVGTFLGMVLVSLLVRWQGGKPLAGCERRKARWFLWNGFVIHFLMDGMVGGFGQIPLLLAQYEVVDKRYNSVRETGTYSIPVTIAFLEVFIWTPLCVATYYAIRRGLPSAAPLQLCTALLQLIGTIIFTLPEVLEGFPNIVTDPHLEFTLHHITYFWFGFGLNFLWVVVPLVYLVEAFGMCAAGHPGGKKVE